MSFFEELKRRNVFRVGIAYLIAAWLALQVVDVIGPMLSLPDWIGPTILLLLAVGFVVSVFIAWAYEVTPEGIKRERDVDRTQSITHTTGRKLDFVVIAVLVVALAFFAVDKFVWQVQEIELEKSIAVIPFANRSADENDAYFVEGMHDDILTQLHKLSGIEKVISRTSVEQYRDTELPIPEIATELGVAWILEGGVQRSGDTIRVNVQLINAATDEHAWAEIYDRQLTTANVFEIQSEISATIAESLQATLTEDEANDLNALPTNSLAAWESYQLGKYAMRDDRSQEALTLAFEHFEKAIELDEDFALAHVGRAEAITLLTTYGADAGSTVWESSDDALLEAQASAKRALEIDPRSGEAYTALAYVHFQMLTREDLVQADFYYRKAGRLSPNYALLHRWHAQVLWLPPLNKPVEALSKAKLGVALDPMNSINHGVLGWAYELNGRVEESRRHFDRAVEISPTNVFGVREKTKFLRRQSEFSSAIVAGLDSLNRFDDYPRILYEIARSYRGLGDFENYEYWSSRVLQTGHYFYSRLNSAMQAMDEGKFDSAIQQYEEAHEWWPDYWDITHALGYAHVLNERPETLLDLVETYAPEMLNRENPAVPPQGAMLVAPTVWALSESGESAHADMLVELGLEIARTGPRHDEFGYGVEIADVEMHAVQGNHRSALDALTQTVEGGYRNPEWLKRSPFLDPIRSEPEFIAAMDVIREEMARQRAELEEMERNGELPPLPK